MCCRIAVTPGVTEASKFCVMTQPQARWDARDDTAPVFEINLTHIVMPPSML